MAWDAVMTIGAVPAIQLVAGLLAATRRRSAWPAAEIGASLALLLATTVALHAAWVATAGDASIDGPGVVVTWLVAFLGWVVVRYSRRQLTGEAGQQRYVVGLMTTLAAVGCVVASQHLGVVLFAWMASSLSLHGLLTFYRERRAARLVAYKKFLASRLAEACLAVALVLIYRSTGTLQIDELAARVAMLESLPFGLHAAMVLIAAAALVKCAQLPLHGWLIQVMEAPTPVSALLHAGVVNIAGLVLIRLGSMLAMAPVAQGLLLVVGSATAVFAALAMATRISIKVRLAWSTCAQMGFMLVECALGLYDLALLHLVAHSLYKAHAFLTAGEAVTAARHRDLLPARAESGRHELARRLAGLPMALVITSATIWLGNQLQPGFTVPWIAAWLLALGLATVTWQDESVLRATGRMFALATVYLAVHAAFGSIVPAAPVGGAFAAWAVATFLALYLLQAWLVGAPRSRWSQVLHRWAYAGLYLDERYTRLALAFWPARWPSLRDESSPVLSTAQEPRP